MRTFIGLVVLAIWPLLAWTATQAAATEAHYVTDAPLHERVPVH